MGTAESCLSVCSWRLNNTCMSKAAMNFVADDASQWTSFQDTGMSEVCTPELLHISTQSMPVCSQTDPLPLELVHQLIAHCEKGGLLFLFLCHLQRDILWREAQHSCVLQCHMLSIACLHVALCLQVTSLHVPTWKRCHKEPLSCRHESPAVTTVHTCCCRDAMSALNLSFMSAKRLFSVLYAFRAASRSPSLACNSASSSSLANTCKATVPDIQCTYCQQCCMPKVGRDLPAWCRLHVEYKTLDTAW